MKCERCRSYHGYPAEFRIVGEILDLKVCRECVGEAEILGLRRRRIEALSSQSSRLSQPPSTPM